VGQSNFPPVSYAFQNKCPTGKPPNPQMKTAAPAGPRNGGAGISKACGHASNNTNRSADWQADLIKEIGTVQREIAIIKEVSDEVVEDVGALLDTIASARKAAAGCFGKSGRDHHRGVAEEAAHDADRLLKIRYRSGTDLPGRTVPLSIPEIRRGLAAYREITAAQIAAAESHIGVLVAFLREDGSWERAWSCLRDDERTLAELERMRGAA